MTKATHTEASTEASQFACGNDKTTHTVTHTVTPQFACGNDKATHTEARTVAWTEFDTNNKPCFFKKKKTN